MCILDPSGVRFPQLLSEMDFLTNFTATLPEKITEVVSFGEQILQITENTTEFGF